MARRKRAADTSTLPLFPNIPGVPAPKVRTYARLRNPIWTENKARFIQQYLRLFVQVTKHASYIDGFARPQYENRPDCWAAKLVLEIRLLRHFHFCDVKRRNLKLLEALKAATPERDSQGRKTYRTVEVYPGDFNVVVDQIVTPAVLDQEREATFCLLDQRSCECHWATVQKVADYKRGRGPKIELFYFLGISWLHRALKGYKKHAAEAEAWWGKADWRSLANLSSQKIRDAFIDRFKSELGYSFVAAYPIYDRRSGGRVMYYMIHASDHEEAPSLMVRAYNRAVRSTAKGTQERFAFVELPSSNSGQ